MKRFVGIYIAGAVLFGVLGVLSHAAGAATLPGCSELTGALQQTCQTAQTEQHGGIQQDCQYPDPTACVTPTTVPTDIGTPAVVTHNNAGGLPITGSDAGLLAGIGLFALLCGWLVVRSTRAERILSEGLDE